MPPRISVIVPIYNAASTLRAAVQSILTQDIAGLEVLLVDDGSTDATPGLCHDLALRDDRIQVITQKNAGICAARNRGLSVAEGMYVTFCDDDDLLLPGALALLLQKAEDTGADIVRADYELIHISPDGTETPQPHPGGTACDLAADGDYTVTQEVKLRGIVVSSVQDNNYFDNCLALQSDLKPRCGITLRTDETLYRNPGEELEIDLKGAVVGVNAETGVMELKPVSDDRVVRSETTQVTPEAIISARPRPVPAATARWSSLASAGKI